MIMIMVMMMMLTMMIQEASGAPTQHTRRLMSCLRRRCHCALGPQALTGCPSLRTIDTP